MTEAEYKKLNDRFDERIRLLCTNYKYEGASLAIYKFTDVLQGSLQLKGSEIMHDSDDLFNYKIKYNFKWR